MMRVERFRLSDIAALPGRRNLDPETVERLAASISQVGMNTPPTIRILDEFVDEDGVIVNGQPVLVTGAHRIAAAKLLGWEKIECFVMEDGDEIDAKLWEIAENLHRADLSALERSHQIAEWVRLTEEKGRLVLRQVAAKPQGGRPESGVRAASRELGIEEKAARRAIQIDSLPGEAKAEAVALGLDDKQSVLIAAVRSDDPVAELRAHKQREENKKRQKEAKADDGAIRHQVAEEFAEWLLARIAPSEISTLVYWIEGSKPSELIAALRRGAA